MCVVVLSVFDLQNDTMIIIYTVFSRVSAHLHVSAQPPF